MRRRLKRWQSLGIVMILLAKKSPKYNHKAMPLLASKQKRIAKRVLQSFLNQWPHSAHGVHHLAQPYLLKSSTPQALPILICIQKSAIYTYMTSLASSAQLWLPPTYANQTPVGGEVDQLIS